MNKSSRWIILITLVSMLLFATAGIAFADAPAKGEVKSIDINGRFVTLETKNGDVVVALPADFDIYSIVVGDYLMAKGVWVSESELTADWVKVFADKEDVTHEDEDEGEKPEKEEKQYKSAYCTGKKEGFHPLAEKLAEKFSESTDVSAEQIQEWYCEKNSMGAIMLALMTQEKEGTPAADILAQRNEGKSWGKIWQEMGIIGKEKDGMPPSQLKKLDKKTPPGQLKKTPEP